MSKGTALLLAATMVVAVGCSSRNDDVRPVVYQPQPNTRPAMTEPQIIALLNTIHQNEIQEGQLAQQRAASPLVREFASREQVDHAAMTQQASNLASRMNLQPGLPAYTSGMTAEHQMAAEAIRGKSGYEFDRAYVAHNIQEHQRALRMLDDVARDSRNPDVQMLLAQSRPMIEGHLRQALEIDRQMQVNPPPPPSVSGGVAPLGVAPLGGY